MAIARESGLIVGQRVMRHRSWDTMQALVDELPIAQHYCSDAFNIYQELVWPACSTHIVSRGKQETYTVESLNANLRTYLGRLKRRSRCFSRCLDALERALRLFVWHYNRRQRLLLVSPHYRNTLALVF